MLDFALLFEDFPCIMTVGTNEWIEIFQSDETSSRLLFEAALWAIIRRLESFYFQETDIFQGVSVLKNEIQELIYTG